MANLISHVRPRALLAAATVVLLGAPSGTSAAPPPVQFDTTTVTTYFSLYAVQGGDVVITCAVSGHTEGHQETFNRNRATGNGSLSCSGPADTKKFVTGSNVQATLKNMQTGETVSAGATDCGNGPLHCPGLGGTMTCDANSAGACNNRFRTYVTAFIVTNEDIDPGSLSDQCELPNSKTMKCTTFNSGVVL